MSEEIEVIGEPNHLLIQEMWAFISRDAKGNEGLCASQLRDGSWMPLVTADWRRVESMRKLAEKLAKHTPEHKIVLCKFHLRKEIEVIGK